MARCKVNCGWPAAWQSCWHVLIQSQLLQYGDLRNVQLEKGDWPVVRLNWTFFWQKWKRAFQGMFYVEKKKFQPIPGQFDGPSQKRDSAPLPGLLNYVLEISMPLPLSQWLRISQKHLTLQYPLFTKGKYLFVYHAAWKLRSLLVHYKVGSWTAQHILKCTIKNKPQEREALYNDTFAS